MFRSRRTLILLLLLTFCYYTIIKYPNAVFGDGRTHHYEPNWESLDARPLPSWYDESKIGIFMHFGPYSVPGVGSEWFWMRSVSNKTHDDKMCAKYLKDNFDPRFTYQDFGPLLKMDLFDADKISEIVSKSGAKYIVFTSKHHDGFTNFPSAYSNSWNSMDVGPKRDVLKEIKESLERKTDVKFGLYYSLFEWFHPLYMADAANKFKTRKYVEWKMQPEMEEVVSRYHPHVLWVDGDWGAKPEYFGSQKFLAWLYNSSPVKDSIVTNDRWGQGTQLRHGGFFSGPDNFQPNKMVEHKWESAFPIDMRSWGHRRNMQSSDVLSYPTLMQKVISTVALGGNALINVGPSSQGTIEAIFEERLLQMGQWLKTFGNACIYKTRPLPSNLQKDLKNGAVYYTQTKSSIFMIFLRWPAMTSANNKNVLSVRNLILINKLYYRLNFESMQLLRYGNPENLNFHNDGGGITNVFLPSFSAYIDASGSGSEMNYFVAVHGPYVVKIDKLSV